MLQPEPVQTHALLLTENDKRHVDSSVTHTLLLVFHHTMPNACVYAHAGKLAARFSTRPLGPFPHPHIHLITRPAHLPDPQQGHTPQLPSKHTQNQKGEIKKEGMRADFMLR